MKIVVRLKDGVLGVLNELQPQMMTQRAVNQHRLARQDEHLQHRVGRAIGTGRPIGIEIEDQLLALAGRHGGYELDAVVRDGINHDVFRGSKLALASFAERKPHIPAPIGHVEPHNPAVFN